MPTLPENWESAQAVILQVKDTSKRFNDDRLYLLKLTLEVHPNNRAPYQTEIERVLSADEQRLYGRNAILKVRFLKTNPKQVFVVQAIVPTTQPLTPEILRTQLTKINNKKDRYTNVVASSDGNYAIVTFAEEMRMSHWVDVGAFWDLPAARTTELGGSLWSVENIAWHDDGTQVKFEMRRYPGDAPSVSIVLMAQSGRCELVTSFEKDTVMLAELSERLELYYREHGDPASWY